ncbi:MAG: hypothetical protein KGL39_07625 [Patescibacteria group bacterium]|nr:hypothetical protein [Patescibacteria group bacterium]
MPLPGLGVSPQSGPLSNELADVVRRAFVSRLVVQMYFASPTLFYLWGNAQRAAGGLNQVTIPLQGQSMVQGQYTGYGGGFNSPVITPGIQNGQWNLAYWVCPVPLPFGETIIQSTETVIPLIKARMNDVYAVTKQRLAQDLFTNNTNNALLPNSFYDAFDNGTNVPTYGGINRNAAGNANYKGQYIDMSTQFTGYSVSTVGFTRAAMAAVIEFITDNAGGEKPTFGVMNPADHATFNKDVISIEQQFVRPGGNYNIDTTSRTSFPNNNVSGVPIFADHFVPKGTMYFSNMKYSNIYISEDAALDFSGFYSLVPLGQIGQQGVCVLGWNFISSKSSSGAKVVNIGGPSW